MFFEIGAALTLLNTINQGIETLRQTSSNLEAASKLLTKYQESNDKISRWEQRTLARRPLTSSESLKLASCRAKQRQIESSLKSHFLMLPGGMVIYNDAMKLKAQSERERERYLKTVAKRRAEWRRKVRGVTYGLIIGLSLIIISVGGYFFYDVVQEQRIKMAKEKLKKLQVIQRNIRSCGRPKC